MTAKTGPHSLSDVRAVFTPNMAIVQHPADTPDFYASLDRDFGGFKDHALISEFSFDADWGMWEMHPNGDEFIYLLEGAIDMIWRTADGEHTARLDAPGQFVVIPEGAWHTARTSTGARTLVVTPGEGTQHAEMPPF